MYRFFATRGSLVGCWSFEVLGLQRREHTDRVRRPPNEQPSFQATEVVMCLGVSAIDQGRAALERVPRFALPSPYPQPGSYGVPGAVVLSREFSTRPTGFEPVTFGSVVTPETSSLA